MDRNEKLVLIRDVPAAIVDALDGIMATQGLSRIATREIAEDFTPLLSEDGGPVVFVLSEMTDDWTACYSSLTVDDEWQLCEVLAISLEQPTAYAIFSDATATYAYRYFADSVLHEERLPDDDTTLDSAGLVERLAAHAIPQALIDDRTLSFDQQHLLVGYAAPHHADASQLDGARNVDAQDPSEIV